MAQICREHSLSEATFYTWKRQYGGVNVSELQRLKHLEDENRRLKQLVADLSLENQVVKEVLRKKEPPPRPAGRWPTKRSAAG